MGITVTSGITFQSGFTILSSAEPAGLSLTDLTDVLITDPQDGDELTYQDGEWVNQQ